MSQKQIENRALVVTMLANGIVAAAGITMYFITKLNLMFVDGFFSLVALASTLIAVLISKYSYKTTRHYPHGMYFLEPLYAVFKAVLMIVLMLVALVNSAGVAYEYFAHGTGQIMETAPIPFYSAGMTALCLGLAFFNNRQYKKTNCTSTMLLSESKTNLLDGLQSAGIGIVILLLWMIPIESSLGFLHYTGDFFITLVLVLISLKDPVVLFFDAFRELSGGVTTDRDICNAVATATGLSSDRFEVYKIGMRIKVRIPAAATTLLDIEKKEQMLQNLKAHYEHAEIEYVI